MEKMLDWLMKNKTKEKTRKKLKLNREGKNQLIWVRVSKKKFVGKRKAKQGKENKRKRIEEMRMQDVGRSVVVTVVAAGGMVVIST